MMTPISSCLHTIQPLYTPTCYFSRFCTLLCAYTIYFFLIYHCTNSLSSLHIFVHQCTFCASLHTKTSPACSYVFMFALLYRCMFFYTLCMNEAYHLAFINV